MTAPPPVAITRRIDGSPSAWPSEATAARSRSRNPASPSPAKMSEIVRPAVRSIVSSRSTKAASWRWASRRPTALLPLPGSPTRTTSMASLVVAATAGDIRAGEAVKGCGGAGARLTWSCRAGAGLARRLADPLAIGGRVRLCLRERVAAELVEDRVGQDQHDHCLGDDARGGDDADIGAFVVGLLDRLAAQQIRRGEGPGERRDRLDRAADDERLAVRDAAGQPTGVVRPMDPAAVGRPALDHVVDGRAEPARLLEPQAELHALDDVDAHDGGCQGGVEPPIPMNIRTEPDRQTVDDNLEDATDRIAVRPGLVDPGDHRGLGVRVRAAQGRGIGLVPWPRRPSRIEDNPTNLRSERPDLD